MKKILFLAITLGFLFSFSCKKDCDYSQPAAQIDYLQASPSVINAGNSTTIDWKTKGYTSLSLTGIGNVTSVGSITVMPTLTTTYKLIAKKNGMSADTATVTIIVQ